MDTAFNALNSEPTYDVLYKVVVIGETGVGKSALMRRFTDPLADDMTMRSSRPTIGVDFKSTLVKLDDGNWCKCQLWDTAGQERYKAVASSYYRGALGAILVYDVTFADSFFRCIYWLDELTQHCPEATVMLVGNKTDLVSSDAKLRAVESSLALDWSQEHGLLFMECSAMDSSNVSDAFVRLLNAIKPKREANGFQQKRHQPPLGSTYKHSKGENIKLSRRPARMEKRLRNRLNDCC